MRGAEKGRARQWEERKFRKKVGARLRRELDHRTWGLSFPWGHEIRRRIMSKGFSHGGQSHKSDGSGSVPWLPGEGGGCDPEAMSVVWGRGNDAERCHLL